MSKNPFRLTDDGAYHVLADGSDQVTVESPYTIVIPVDRRDGPYSGSSVMKVDGIWHPPLGSVIEATDPNRDLEVVHVKYQVYGDGGFFSLVFVYDPQDSGD